MADRYIDWKDILEFIEGKEDKSILELGCGVGTSILTDSFKSVFSYETNHRDKKGKWFRLTSSQQEEKENWQGYFESNAKTMEEVKNSIIANCDVKKHSVLFVDPGFHTRYEIGKLLCEYHKFEYVFFHDTNFPEYDYKLLIKMEDEYELVGEIRTGQGTKLYKRR